MNTEYKQQADKLIKQARKAAQKLVAVSEEDCNKALERLATLLVEESAYLIEENKKDLIAGEEKELSSAMLERLSLTEKNIAGIADGVRAVASLSASLGEELSSYDSPKDFNVKKIRVPLGVICIIYESRPNVSIETSILSLKSRNAIILKGGSEAKHSNHALVSLVHRSLSDAGIDPNSVQLVGDNGRQVVHEVIQTEEGVDLVIPRGGEGLIRAVAEASRVPVLKHYKGVCHVYVDEAADLEKALPICVNAKCQRPSVCNAAETILVHEAVAADFLPKLGEALKEKGVTIKADDETRKYISDAENATEDDWHAEYLELTVAIKVISSLSEAIDHINHYGSHHTDAIISTNNEHCTIFANEVDSGSVMLNTTTRFSDGFEYGLGAELGISTDKVHARGPMGLEGLTTYKWIVTSDGAIKE